MSSSLIDTVFRLHGRLDGARPGPSCPSDELLAGLFDATLAATERRGVEDHLMVCAPCHGLHRALVDLRAVPATQRRPFRIVARLAERGLQLINAMDLTVRAFRDGPALGALRRTDEADGSTNFVSVAGPGLGLDLFELQFQANGEVRLAVSGNEPPPLQPGEVSSIILEVDGAPREKRPYTGEPLAFAPLGHGHFRLRLVARAPGGQARELTDATLELRQD